MNGTAMIEHQKANRSNVRILKAFSPSSNFGNGVVPPVPSIKQITKEIPQAKNLGTVKRRKSKTGRREITAIRGITKNIRPELKFCRKLSREP